jgi:hypothetical protein
MPVSLGIVVAWTATVVAIAVFLVFGMVEIGAGNWLGRRLGVAEIWSRFLGYLASQGASPLTVLLVAAAAALSLVTAALVLWLALTLRDQPRGAPDDSPAGE